MKNCYKLLKLTIISITKTISTKNTKVILKTMGNPPKNTELDSIMLNYKESNYFDQEMAKNNRNNQQSSN